MPELTKNTMSDEEQVIRIKDNEDKIQQHLERLNNDRYDIDELKKRLDRVSEAIGGVDIVADTKQKDIDKLKTDLKDAQNQIDDLQTKLAGLTTYTENKLGDTQTDKTEYNNRISANETSITQINNSITELKANIDSIANKVNDVTANIDTTSLSNAISNLSDSIEALKKSEAAAEKSIAANSQRITEVEDSKAAYKTYMLDVSGKATEIINTDGLDLSNSIINLLVFDSDENMYISAAGIAEIERSGSSVAVHNYDKNALSFKVITINI